MNTSEWEQSIDLPAKQPSYDDSIARALPLPLIERMVERIDLPITDRLLDAEAVINRVVEVTQSNQTSERILERKHEVKDFAAKETQKQQFTVRINEILGPQSNSQRMSASNREYDAERSTKPAFFKRLMTTKSLYGYAIRYGFICAVLSLLVAILITQIISQ